MMSDVSILKSPNDQREYRYLKLENELSVVLVSDATLDQASACLSVGVGSMSNPEDSLGLAHFLEHMLFMGTEKYPTENELRSFVLSNGGSYNGSTSPSLTTYYFSVNQDKLEQAIDRFSSFFVCPLFSESGTTREINAVNSEHNNNLQNDDRRHLYMHISQYEGHPLGRFATGNLDTLKVESGLREKMMEFYHKYYSANIMTLAIVGRDPLDKLEQFARQYFSPIKNHSVQRPSFPTLNLPKPTKINLVPVKNQNRLALHWPISNPEYLSQINYKNNTMGLVSHILGHESSGSLYALLHKLGYVYSLFAGNHSFEKSVEVFSLKMDLTELGLTRVDEIISIVYQYVHLIDENLPSYVFGEKQIQNQITWDSLPKRDAIVYSTQISNGLLRVPNSPQDVLKYYYFSEELKLDHFVGIGKLLNPQAMTVIVASKSFEGKTDLVEPFYGVHYTLEHLDSDKLQQWRNLPKHPELYIVKPNPFIPKDFAIKFEQDSAAADIEPKRIYNDKGVELYHLPDRQFNTPFAEIKIQLISPQFVSCANQVNLRLFRRAIKEVLNEEILYYLKQASTTVKVDCFISGNDITFKGYNDKLFETALRIFKFINEFDISQSSFDTIKEKTRLGYINLDFRSAYMVGLRVAGAISINNSYPTADKLALLASITRDSFVEYINIYFRSINFRILVAGNVTESECLTFVRDLQVAIPQRHPCLESDLKAVMRMCCKKGVECKYKLPSPDPEQTNSVAIAGFDCGAISLKKTAIATLLRPILHESFFSQLRSVQQLGYVVAAYHNFYYSTIAFQLIVQSNTKSCDYILERVKEFLVEELERLKQMSDEKFAERVKSGQDRLMVKSQNIFRLVNVHWDNFMVYGEYRANVKLVGELATLTKRDLIDFFQKYFVDINQRKLLTTQLYPRSIDIPDEQSTDKLTIIRDNHLEFKNKSKFYPNWNGPNLI